MYIEHFNLFCAECILYRVVVIYKCDAVHRNKIYNHYKNWLITNIDKLPDDEKKINKTDFYELLESKYGLPPYHNKYFIGLK